MGYTSNDAIDDRVCSHLAWHPGANWEDLANATGIRHKRKAGEESSPLERSIRRLRKRGAVIVSPDGGMRIRRIDEAGPS